MALLAGVDQMEAVHKPSLDPLSELLGSDLECVNRLIVERMQSPVALIPQLAGHIVASGGKRLRPMLTLGCARLCGYQGTRHVALAAVVWGLVLPVRPLAWAATAIGVVALALALVHYDEKPSGVSVLGGAAPTSVWDKSRAQVLARWLHPGEDEVVATLERQARKGDTIALAIRRKDVSYPYFGERLDRRVVFVGAARPEADWLVVAPREPAHRAPAWKFVAGGNGWRLYRRGG